MMAMVEPYWQRLSVREQGLVMAAGVLLACVALWLGVAQPMLAWRDAARAAYAGNAADQYEITAGIARYQALQAYETGGTAEREPVRSVVAGSANRAGIVLSRVLPDEAGRLNIWIEGVDPARLMQWLETLSRDHGVIVVRAGLERSGEDLLRAQLLLARGGA